MAPLTRRLLACAPAVLLGVICFIARVSLLRTSSLSELLTHTSSETKGTFYPSVIFQAWAVLKAGVNHPAGLLLVGELCFLTFVFLMLAGFESSRGRANWGPVLTVPLFLLTSATFGASFSFATVWLPFYLLTVSGSYRNVATVEKNALSLRRLCNCTGVLPFALTSLVMAFTFAHQHPPETGANTLPGVLNSLLVILILLLAGSSSSAPTAHKVEEMAVAGTMIAAGVTLLWRLFTHALIFTETTSISSLILTVLTTMNVSDPADAAVRLFALDLVGTALSFAYFALIEDGLIVALCTVIGTLVVGPAPAFALYCTYREKQIANALKNAEAATLAK